MYMDSRCGDSIDMSSLGVDTLKLSLTSNISYDNDMNCSMIFSTDTVHKLELRFDRFATEPGYDLLHIHDGTSSSSPYIAGMKGPLSGRTDNHNVYMTSGRYLFLHFTSDSSTHDTGFTITISTYFTGYKLEDAIDVSCGENGWDITVHMDKLRQIYPNAKASDIYLGDNTCTGTLSGERLTFRQGLRECLTTEMKRDNILVYHNELIYAEHDPRYPFIIRHYNWTAGIECDVNRNSSLTGHIHYDNIDHSKEPQITGGSHYTTNMSFYIDPNFVHGVPGNPLHLSVGERLFVKVYTDGTDWTIKMRVHTCYTKPAITSSDQMKFYLIKNGCEVDTNTHIISQSPHETKFTFEAFEYTSYHEGIQVYCDATFCGWDDYSRECSQTCNPVIRRRG
ncbi:CUB and zona pellucida-like domain-containing protein 1 [Mercenaria mercenaria]|uniref:CUB and zona pellucida-like domain-containing protein 1 n=1 Tax=Mercenaria mercenaria TaxID=6596 RepID=UPI00234E8A77|nr:CUB and zona pellucida-like domain-containing protein 1 [Mercenaria mercenaria]